MWSPKRVAAALFALGIVETAAGARAFPHLGLPLVVWTALRGGPAAGMKAGLCLGAMLDLGGAERFGTFAVVYAAAGFCCGLLKGKVFPEAVITQWLLPGAFYALVLAAEVFSAAPDPDFSARAFYFGLLRQPSLLTTVLASPLVFIAADRLCFRPETPRSRGIRQP